MKNIYFLITSLLMSVSISAYTQPSASNSDSALVSVKKKNIYKLVLSGQETEIKKYFGSVTLDELIKSDSGAIVKAFKRINTNNKVSRTIWILEEVKNRSIEIRAYVYNELLNIDFGKPSFLLNHMINNYFTNYTENEDSLSEKVRKLHGKMNR